MTWQFEMHAPPTTDWEAFVIAVRDPTAKLLLLLFWVITAHTCWVILTGPLKRKASMPPRRPLPPTPQFVPPPRREVPVVDESRTNLLREKLGAWRAESDSPRCDD
jgi:hypothetical protein